MIVDSVMKRTMKKALDVIFRHHNGEGEIELITSRDDRLIKENTTSVAVRSEIQTYSADYNNELDRAFTMIHGSSYSSHWQTVVQFVKKDDVLRLRWGANGQQNQYAKEAEVKSDSGHYKGLNVDTLTLIVSRGEKEYSFLLDVSICPTNTARMISSEGISNGWVIA